MELSIGENGEVVRKHRWSHDPYCPLLCLPTPHCAGLTIESHNVAMGKNYLNSQTLQSFGKLSPSSSDKVFIRSRTKVHKPFVRNSLQISQRSHTHKLPFRLRHSKMSSSSSPKRSRRDSNASDRPSKQQRCSSEPGTAHPNLPL